MKKRLEKTFFRFIQELLKLFGSNYSIHIKDRKTKRIDSYPPIDTEEWFEWLERPRTRSITVHEMGVYDDETMATLRKDYRNKWHAEAVIADQLYRLYIGESKEMTGEAMVDSVLGVHQIPRRPWPGTLPWPDYIWRQ